MSTTASVTEVPGLGIGSMVQNAVSIYFSNFFFFTFVGLIFSAPSTLFMVFYPPFEPGPSDSLNYGPFFAAIAVDMIANGLLTAIFLYSVIMLLRGTPVSAGHAVSVGLSRAGFALAATLVVTLALIASFTLLVIPGLIAICYLFVAVPAATIERIGPIKAMSRSVKLTKGYRWTIFGFFLIYMVASAIVDQLLTFALGDIVAASLGLEALVLVTSLAYVPFLAMQAIASGYAYVALAGEKDGHGAEKIAALFD